MKVSVIIPTFNEGKVIGDCLDSLSKQTMDEMEIIVVDDGSTDKTLKVLSKYKVSGIRYQVLKQNHKGAGAARNLGAKRAKGEILVFVDADMTFEKYFVKNLTSPILEGKSLGTWSREEYVTNWENLWARCLNINEGWQEKRRHSKNHPKKQKVFRAILKKEFNRVGGFDPSRGYSDDWSLSEKLGYEADQASGAIFYHKNPDNLAEIYTQSKWIAKRQYKFGKIGMLIALIRASFPVSIPLGLFKSIKYKEPAFIVFKIVYDLGIFVGILEHLLTGKISK